MGDHAIARADVLSALRELPSESVDGILSDPPYGFRFMGKKWDYDVPSVDVWRECLRVLKPGGHLLSFGGSRTFHRVAIGIEDAGLELRDCLTWLYGKGFPKSMNIAWEIDRAAGIKRKGNDPPVTELAKKWAPYGTALKPAWEPIIVARKELDAKVIDNVAELGTGALAIDACRIDVGDGEGRWPANLILDEEAGALLDAAVGSSKSVPYRENEAEGAVLPFKKRAAGGYSDEGGPSRFFYCAKVSTKERELGCESLPLRSAGECTDREDGSKGLSSPRAGAGRGGGARNPHPTLKPIALTTWLARLILPPTPDATLLVPYSGVGSEMIGGLLAGWPNVFGIEGDFDDVGYVEIAHSRIKAWTQK